ncbi:ADP-forming succinate--CoA ligase subunit beta [Paradesulfitobacterium ferrireducens]|uniref:ADP-forming succinate--CoA ligase subunit beta n=1 Tax=Paradesulfitobacterium ferrireducens TaxID=2816476 RepID=UPI001A8FBF35|nr:ADP-forming succinate--CoA ligase subunit beta [Paradesulfitobacterium ferrireducens]
MKLYEYMAKEIFHKSGIAVPRGAVYTRAEDVVEFVSQHAQVAIKSQVLSGGRGKAGGIKFADNAEEAVECARQLLNLKIKGLKVETILVEEKLQIDKEIYVAITVDSSAKRPLLLASAAGGMEIEEVPDEKLIKRLIDINIGLRPYAAKEIARRLGLNREEAAQVSEIILKMYQIFCAYDAELVEINPLVVSEGRVLAADGKITLDDEATFRYPQDVPIVEERTEREVKARELGISYVELEGDIGVMANGAGITMATIDIIKYFGGEARNFMDAGGGASTEAMVHALEILLSTEPKALLINVFGGITRCDDVARAYVQVKNSLDIKIPVVIRLVGTNQAEGVAILRDHGIDSYEEVGEAVKRVVALARSSAKGA